MERPAGLETPITDAADDPNAMPIELSTEDKYRRLLVAYARLKSQNKVVKDAILEERTAYQSLQGEMVVLQGRVHTMVQENDMLAFNNKRLTKRLERMLEGVQKPEPQSNAKTKGKSLVGWMLGGRDDDRHRLEDELAVVTEHLQQKIKENEEIHNTRHELQRVHAEEVLTLTNHVKALEVTVAEGRDQLVARITELNSVQVRTAELEAELGRMRARAESAEQLAASLRLAASSAASAGGSGGGGGPPASCGHLRAACLRDGRLLFAELTDGLGELAAAMPEALVQDASAPLPPIAVRLGAGLAALASDVNRLGLHIARAGGLCRNAACRLLGRDADAASYALRASDRQCLAAAGAVTVRLHRALALTLAALRAGRRGGLAAVDAADAESATHWSGLALAVELFVKWLTPDADAGSTSGTSNGASSGQGDLGMVVQSLHALAALADRRGEVLSDDTADAAAMRVRGARAGEALRRLARALAALLDIGCAFRSSFEGAHVSDVDPLLTHAGYAAPTHELLSALRARALVPPDPASAADVDAMQREEAAAALPASDSGQSAAAASVPSALAPSLSVGHSEELLRLQAALAARTAELAVFAEGGANVRVVATGEDRLRYRPYTLLTSRIAAPIVLGGSGGSGGGGEDLGDELAYRRESARLRTKLSAADARAGELYQTALAARDRVRAVQRELSESVAAAAGKAGRVAELERELEDVRSTYESQLDSFTNHICSLNANLASQTRQLDGYRRQFGELSAK